MNAFVYHEFHNQALLKPLVGNLNSLEDKVYFKIEGIKFQ